MFDLADMAMLLEVGAELLIHIELLLGGKLPSESHHPRERDRTRTNESGVVDLRGEGHMYMLCALQSVHI